MILQQQQTTKINDELIQLDKGELEELDAIIAQDKLNDNVYNYMYEKRLDQEHAFRETTHITTETSDDVMNTPEITNETQQDEVAVQLAIKLPKRRQSFSSQQSKFAHHKSQVSELNETNEIAKAIEEDKKRPWKFVRNRVEPPQKPPKRFTDTYFQKLDVNKDKKVKHKIREMPANGPYPLNVYDRDYIIQAFEKQKQ